VFLFDLRYHLTLLASANTRAMRVTLSVLSRCAGVQSIKLSAELAAAMGKITTEVCPLCERALARARACVCDQCVRVRVCMRACVRV